MSIFSFFQKKSYLEDYSFLELDFHSHVLPGIDDGAKNANESIDLIKGLKELGFKNLVATPHIYDTYYPNNLETISAAFKKLKKVGDEGLIEGLWFAAEYYLDEDFISSKLDSNSLLTFSGQHVLVEFSMLAESLIAEGIIDKLIEREYKVIIAHPERYLYYKNKGEQLKIFRNKGCYFQTNILSLSGYYGMAQKKFGIELIESGIVDFLSTDLHRSDQFENLKSIFFDKKMCQLIQEAQFKNPYLNSLL